MRDSIFGGGQISGTSTITQQLARNVYLSGDKEPEEPQPKDIRGLLYHRAGKEPHKRRDNGSIPEHHLSGVQFIRCPSSIPSIFFQNVQDLNTLECAALAALPQSPDTYSIIVADYEGSTTSSLPTVASTDSATFLYNGDISKDRRDMVLRNMEREGYITEDEDEPMAER